MNVIIFFSVSRKVELTPPVGAGSTGMKTTALQVSADMGSLVVPFAKIDEEEISETAMLDGVLASPTELMVPMTFA